MATVEQRARGCAARRATRGETHVRAPRAGGARTCRKVVEKKKDASPTSLDMIPALARLGGGKDEHKAQHTPQTEPHLHKGATRPAIDAPARMLTASARARSRVPAQPRIQRATAAARSRWVGRNNTGRQPGVGWLPHTPVSTPAGPPSGTPTRKRAARGGALDRVLSTPTHAPSAAAQTPGHPVTHQPGTEGAPRRSACLDGAGLLIRARKRRDL